MLIPLPGDDLVLCQITSQIRPDPYAVALTAADFTNGRLAVDSSARVSRLFTIDQSAIVYVAASITPSKLAEAKEKVRQLFT